MPISTKPESTMRRVMIPVHTDRWMKGDKYGTIQKQKMVKRNRMSENGDGTAFVMIFWIKMDRSGDVIRCIAENCKLL